MNNKKLGNKFEKDLCELLAIKGFWAYNFPNKIAGQPADIIASRLGCPCLIDCKECTNDTFDTVRVEENQKNAMLLWEYRGNGDGYFALKLSDGSIYMINHNIMLSAREKQRTLNRSTIIKIGMPFDDWVKLW